jgi:hypothetical protein
MADAVDGELDRVPKASRFTTSGDLVCAPGDRRAARVGKHVTTVRRGAADSGEPT